MRQRKERDRSVGEKRRDEENCKRARKRRTKE